MPGSDLETEADNGLDGGKTKPDSGLGGGKTDPGSGFDELKRMLETLNEKMSVQAQQLHETVIDSFQNTVDAAQKVAQEQCDRLQVKVEKQLQEVREETGARVNELREEMSELRAAVEKQAAPQTVVEAVGSGEEQPVPCWQREHHHCGPHSEPGDLEAWGAAGGGMHAAAAAFPPFWCHNQPHSPVSLTPPRSPLPHRAPTPPPLPGGNVQPMSPPQACGGASGRRKPAEFDGKVAWEAYQAQFELLARGQEWSSKEMALQLVASLRGPALEILAHLPPAHRASYTRVAGALQQRFGSPYQSEVYRARLKGRVRQHGEQLPQLALDVETLVRRAYPAASEEMVVVLARDSFVDALQYPKMQMYVKQAHPVDLQAALAQALEYEAFTRSTGGAMATTPEPTSPRRQHFQTRRVQTQQAATRKDRAAGSREFRGACWRCGQVGHRRSECKEGRKTRSLDDLRPRSPTSPCCWNCGQQGHMRSSCTQLQDVMLVGGNLDRLGAGATAQPPTVAPHST